MKKKLLLLSLSLTLLGTFSCAHKGPNVEICIVNASAEGYQCASRHDSRFLPFKDAVNEKLSCVDAHLLEKLLKACKNHEWLPITTCDLSVDFLSFKCTPPFGVPYILTLEQADNYACLSPEDTDRIQERCK